ncbi:MAG: cation:proton antiporter [Gammaproteobacteria bacterium]
MHSDPILAYAVAAILITLLISLLMKQIRQSHVVACLLAGIILGPHVTGLFTDHESISRFGSLGVVLLMFFVGMEVSPQRLVNNWKIAILGTSVQVGISVFLVWLLGFSLEWSLSRIVLLGFVISLSSTAVVLKLLQDWNELNTDTGQDVLGVLLVQDLFVVPMLIILNLFAGDTPDTPEILMQICGGIGLISLVVFITIKDQFHIPFLKSIIQDHETQVFTALVFCFGFALITAVLGLSTALGAFVAGMLVSSARETDWVRYALEPFRVIFIALFFVSIGMLLNLDFVLAHSWQVALLVIAVFITNTFINAGTFRAFGESWRESFYAGALLSQIGEFSFVLAAAGYHAAIITDVGYQYAISVILFSLIFSPGWIALMRKLTRR